ncbi:unnamed protein product [Fusarium fujikuroi]|nr:unnamed protein product [Fusarium fujikuroi]
MAAANGLGKPHDVTPSEESHALQLLRKLKHGKTVGEGHVGPRSSCHPPQSTDSLGYDLEAPGHTPFCDRVTSSQEALV